LVRLLTLTSIAPYHLQTSACSAPLSVSGLTPPLSSQCSHRLPNLILKVRNSLSPSPPSKTQLKAAESSLKSHDLALQVPCASQQSINKTTHHTKAPYSKPKRFVHFLILTPLSLTHDNQNHTLERVSRLSSLSSYHIAALAFILNPPGHTSGPVGLQAFSELQVLYALPLHH